MSDFQFPVGAYTRPAADSVDLTFSAQNVDVIVAAVLPLPFVSVVVDGLREVTVAATLPLPSVSVSLESGVALVFSKSAPAGPDLLFGFDDVASIPRADIHVAATLPLPTLRATFAPLAEIQIGAQLPGPTLAVEVRPVTRVEAAFALPGPVLSCEVEYRSNAQRPTVAATRSSHQVAQPTSTGAEHRQHDATASPHGWEAFWQRATGLTLGVEHRQAGTLKHLRVSTAAQHQDAAPMRDSKVFAHQVADRDVRRVLNTAFENASRIQDDTLFRHQDGDRTKRAARRTYWQEASGLGVRQWSSFQPASRLPVAWWSAWQEGVPPPPGGSSKPSGPPGPTPCYAPSPHLLFSFPVATDGHLLFQCGHYTPPVVAGVVVPVRRFYMVINSVSLVRLPSGVELPAYAFSMTVDADSFTWSWSATLDKSAAPHVVREPGGAPVELQALVNGQPYRFTIDRAGRSRQFPGDRIAVSGRGLAAELDAPWAPVMTFGNQAEMTAQQLMSDVLTANGVSIGWALDWRIQDWLVPAGAWQMQGVYIGAVNDIAGAVGAYVQPHPTDRVLRVLPRYPAAPWDWGDLTPDVQLPAAAVQVESTEWLRKPAYTGVFVGGVSAGVFGPVTRGGTSGSLLAPQVTHALITDPVAHLQRGLAVLSDTGDQEYVQLTFQVLPETGIIMPGTLLGYVSDDGPAVGIVRGTSVSWSRPRLRQTIGVETHHA